MMDAAYNIERLNKDFGVAGRIAFRPGPCGEPIVVLVEEHGSCEVAIYGGHILSYRPIGHSPVLWMARDFMSIKPGKPIRGGIPVCWPWFGPDANGGPAHGFARIARWNLLRTAYDSYSTSVTLVLEESPASLAIWPHKFRLELQVSVGANLQVSLTTTNTGDEEFSVAEALHTYFRVKDISNVRVCGLDGAHYFDKVSGAGDSIQSGDISFASETDRVYTSTTAECTIDDSGIHRRIKITKEGSNSTVVWNPWVEKAATLVDMSPEDYKNFVCVETANALSDSIVVKPGAVHKVTAAYSVDLFDSDGKRIGQFGSNK